MKKSFLAMLVAASLLTPVAAQAQRGGEGWQRADRAERGERAPRGPEVRRGEWRSEMRSDRRDDRQDRRSDRRDDRQDWRSDRRDDRQDWRSDRRDWNRGAVPVQRSWDQRWRGDRRYDWQRHRQVNRQFYRQPRYYAPYHVHRYSRISIGFTLAPGFVNNRFWINDPWQYRLPPVYGPYRWVRYYDDVLLVDVRNGRVVDVIHAFFW